MSIGINSIDYQFGYNAGYAAAKAEVKHGRWIWNKRLEEWYCSNCDRIMKPYTVEKSEGLYEMAQPFYCGWCGAKMDKAERMTREEAIRRLEEGAPFSELYDEVWENALIMAIEALKAEPRSIDLQELEDRFGKYVKFVVEDMMSGEGKRWKNEHNY